MQTLNFVIVAFLSTASAYAQESRMVITSLPPLFKAAINSHDGKSAGELQGPLAAAVGRQFKTNAPIFADITTLVRYAQPGCRRLNVHVHQARVVLPGKVAAPMALDIGIDYCIDGTAPRSLAREQP